MAASWSLAEDPEAWIMFTFPWGKRGTPLEHKKGLRRWQREECARIKEHIAENKRRITRGETPIVFKLATTSGRGTGKSAFVAMIMLWLMSTVLGIAIVVTANTETQLKDKTMAEVGKWHTLMINSHWFEKTALSLRPAPWFEELLKTQLKIDTGYYYISAQMWSENNADAFAGLHNEYGLLLIFDEASGIPAPIWKVSDGFFTEKSLHRYWIVFSNPRRNTGPFFECFHRFREFWNRRHINAMQVEESDTTTYENIIKQYGEDSDEARVEVFGLFPKQGDKQFISRSIIDEAVERRVEPDMHAALMMGVDPARYGDDSTVIAFRQGRDGKVIPPIKLKGKDNMEVANECAALIDKYKPDAVCIDAGNGTGIIDRLREMKYKVHEVWFGSKSEERQWGNLRTLMWARMRDWLKEGMIPDDTDLKDDLAGPEYKFRGAGDVQILESKEEMKGRGLASPDYGDAFACTFAVKVARTDNKLHRNKNRGRQAEGMDASIFS